MKEKKKVNDCEVITEKVCKKCGSPLISSTKYKYCDNCRRERTKARKEVMGALGGVAILGLSLVPGVKHFIRKK